jgi:hypothetical protein
LRRKQGIKRAFRQKKKKKKKQKKKKKTSYFTVQEVGLAW